MSSIFRKLIAAAVLVSLGILVTRQLSKRRAIRAKPESMREFDLVDETSDASFPASDAPSWTPMT